VSGDYLWDRSGPRDAGVAELERVLGALRQADPPPPLRLRGPVPVQTSASKVRWLIGMMATAAAVTALVGVVWFSHLDQAPRLDVVALAGTPTIGTRPVGDRASLTAGPWLETDQHARAGIDVGDIGRVELEPRSRLGLVSTRPGDYRLRLQRGTMHALIWAPPGQFFVETPSSTAVDLGCSYTLSIDDAGVGLVQVTTGWVGFEWHGRESFIPAGAVCLTRPGLGPGTPHYPDTSDAYREALQMIDVGGGTAGARHAALGLILRDSRAHDVVTLWHLLARVDAGRRRHERGGVAAGRRDMLDQWWDALGLGTASWWRTWKQQWREK